ncbi:MAG: hypothetical protein ACRC62_03525 [Microcoleus sp.]
MATTPSKPATDPTSAPAAKTKDYEISRIEFGNLVCQQCGEKRRTNDAGVFCPVNDIGCPRYVDPDS